MVSPFRESIGYCSTFAGFFYALIFDKEVYFPIKLAKNKYGCYIQQFLLFGGNLVIV